MKKTKSRVPTKEELASSCFRWINEQLYTSSSEEAQKFFQEDPQLFEVYHKGYKKQLQSWPERPLDTCKKWLREYLKQHKGSKVITDFGCGSVAELETIFKSNRVSFYSFDLVESSDSRVIPCNVTNVPLNDESVDVVICCLSLMGIDYPKIVLEAFRILNKSGYLVIAEVTSRLEGRMELFCSRLSQIGFQLRKKVENNSYFIFLVFQKKSSCSHQPIMLPALKPCLYKKR
eukprot:jgi/Galph1/2228/GphlegSOOS_G884.1